jgi:hypothetical protein
VLRRRRREGEVLRRKMGVVGVRPLRQLEVEQEQQRSSSMALVLEKL